MANEKVPLAIRFWKYVKRTDYCWIWTGCTIRHGYGVINAFPRSRSLKAHRLSWELHYGSIPEGMCVLHKCDNPPCVNPSHLFLGTQTDNMQDMIRKRRHVGGNYRKLTDDQVRAIRRRWAEGNVTRVALALEYGVTRGHIHNLLDGRTRSNIK